MSIGFRYPSDTPIETLSIYRDRDLRHRQRPRRREDREKNQKKDLETVKTVFARMVIGNGSEVSFVGAIGLWRECEPLEAWVLFMEGVHE
jgi:hypothetical protein